MKKALFLDRDGVLIKDNHLITQMKQVEFNPDAKELLQLARTKDYIVLVVTNQTVVSRGMLSLDEAQALNQQIMDQLGGVDRSYICPHHPKAHVAEFRKNCECRKPKSGLLLQAQRDFDIELASSWMVGDRPTDIYAAKAVGVRGILLKTNIAEEKLIESDLDLNPKFLIPDQEVKSLKEVVGLL